MGSCALKLARRAQTDLQMEDLRESSVAHHSVVTVRTVLLSLSLSCCCSFLSPFVFSSGRSLELASLAEATEICSVEGV